ncbi:MAG: hypothetical protein KBS79_03920 [Lachnospiraceae bacterium]|nr:hypothetical protein [Candidatus Minthocola equi]
MKKLIALIFAIVLTFSLTACGSTSKEITIAVPNDASNEARALQLLEKLGYIKLKSDVENVTPLDIIENPYNIKIQEIEAAQIPNVLTDVDFGIINGNYALSSGLLPETQALAVEGTDVAKPNIIAVKEGNENTEKIAALVAAVESQQVADFIKATYGDAVISVVENPGDGFDPDVDYTKLAGETISVAASPVPHCEILKIAAEILAQKGITLDIKEFTDYVQPNNVVESGEVDANYFQHIPYLEDFNAQNGTHIVSVALIHYEPMGLFAGKQPSLDIFK